MSLCLPDISVRAVTTSKEPKSWRKNPNATKSHKYLNMLVSFIIKSFPCHRVHLHSLRQRAARKFSWGAEHPTEELCCQEEFLYFTVQVLFSSFLLMCLQVGSWLVSSHVAIGFVHLNSPKLCSPCFPLFVPCSYTPFAAVSCPAQQWTAARSWYGLRVPETTIERGRAASL